MSNHTPGQLAYLLQYITPDTACLWQVRCEKFYAPNPKAKPSKRGPRVAFKHERLIWKGKDYKVKNSFGSATFCINECHIAFSIEGLEQKFKQAVEKRKEDLQNRLVSDQQGITWCQKHIEDLKDEMALTHAELFSLENAKLPEIT